MENQSDVSNQKSASKKNPFDELNREELITKCKGLLAIAQKAKISRAELQNQIENYKLQLEKCESENKLILENVQTLQELVESLTEQKLNSITEVDKAQSIIKSLNGKCTNYENEIKKYETDIIIRDQNISDITQKLSNLDCEIISLKRQNNRLTEENEQLINQLTEIESKTVEFNTLGLQQQEQLKTLEEYVHKEIEYKYEIDMLKNTISLLENKLKKIEDESKTFEANEKYVKQITELEDKIKEITQLHETEKCKNEKVNIKLRSYKDKILKCATCINQLKNSRYILTKTVKEYSENIPRWQNDIIKASKLLEDQLNDLNTENTILKEKVQKCEKQLNELLALQDKMILKENESNHEALSKENKGLSNQIIDLKHKLNDSLSSNDSLKVAFNKLESEFHELNTRKLPAQINENKSIKEQLERQLLEFNELLTDKNELQILVNNLHIENKSLKEMSKKKNQHNDIIENLNLQIKALESEKSILVKEKSNARDNVVEFENQNKILNDQVNEMKSELQTLKSAYNKLIQENTTIKENCKSETESEVNILKCNINTVQEQYELLKKEHDALQDLNTLLKEEVETLKLSLEQPKDDADNLSDLNVSFQADIVKLETKLSAYKQENFSLLTEVKECRLKMKDYDTLVTDYEEAKTKLSGYKTENNELLNEMKEINQVLKERGEAISKLQKAISEMERLVETLEKDRENLGEEKDQLQKKILGLENELKNAEENTCKHDENTDQIAIERDNAIKELAEKDTIIVTLKDDIERLKQHQSSSVELPNEDMSTSTISKAEEHSRMKDLDETFEDKYTKLRIFALKLKKKLNETLTQLKNVEKDKNRLEKLLAENIGAENTAIQPNINVDLNSAKKENESIEDSNMKVLENLLMQKDTEIKNLKVDLDQKSQQLQSEVDAHNVTKDNLEKAKRDIKKKNVLSLEIEDYEKSLKELTAKMEENKKKMVQMESTIDTQESTITAMKTQIKLLEDQIKTEETLNRQIKEEMHQIIEESKDKDNVIQVKNSVITKLEQDLEDEKRKNEEFDLEMTSVLSDKEKIIMVLGEEKAELNNKVKKLEFRCAELNEKLRITDIELADLKTEYTSYKVRAQAVLRQNQTVDHSQEEHLKEEAAALKSQIESLTSKLVTVQEQLTEQTAELESAKRRVVEVSGEATRGQQRTARLQADLTRIGQQLDAERTQNKLQISTLTQCYKTQIADLEAKLQKETDALKKQLASIQETSSGTSHAVTFDDANRNQYMLPIVQKDEGSDGEMDINVSMIPREEGEGSESAPSPPPSKSFLSSGGRRSPVPLDRLLEEGVPDDEALDTASLALTPDQEIADLRRRLQAQQQRVKHVTVLLSESEREGARLSQLSELLKQELRRVRGATPNAHNAEYMKNVTLKFLTLPPGDERGRLVPVLQKILTLTPDETHKINAVAKGLDPNPSKGWGSYLPWPGGK